MRILHILIALMAFQSVVTNAPAQSTTELTLNMTCPRVASIESAVTRAIQKLAKDKVDTTRYSRPRIRVRLRVAKAGTSLVPVSSNTVLNGLKIVSGTYPTGLAVAVEGNISYKPTEICTYKYRVALTSSGVDLVSGLRLSARTETISTWTVPLSGTVANIED